jgi:serine/threonine protein kinase
MPKQFAFSLNSNSKEDNLNNNNILNYINFNNYNNSNNPANIIKAKLVKNNVQMNNFISPNKNSNLLNNQKKTNNKKDIDIEKDKDMKINSMNTSKIKIFNNLQEQSHNSKNKDSNNTNVKFNIKNKNIVIDNEVYDINIIDINDFSPINDENSKDDNIQEKINKQNQLYINKNNISLLDKNKIKNEYNFNNNNNNNLNCIKNKINDMNRDDLKNRQQYHKYSQSQSLGKKAKDLNKKIIHNMNNIKIKNNVLFEKKVDDNKSKIETKSNSGKVDTSNNNNLNRDKDKNKDKDKEKKTIHLFDLIDSKENSKEIIEKNKIENTKENKNNIFSFKINNSENNNKNNKNQYKTSEIKKIISINNDFEDMIYIPDSPEIRNRNQDNIILTTMSKDCEYYKDEMEQLSNYIKNYYKENGKYPESRIEFYLYGRQIGHGAFGKVNLALHIASGRLVAIKTFSKKHLKNNHTKQKIKNEISILSRLRHPFINQILDSFETDKHIFMIMKYVCGDLLGFIRKRGKLSESISKLIFKQVIEGLKYIHRKKIVHRDIKLDNILIDLTNTVKICDFGVSRKLSNGDVMYEHCGTPAYIAPEIFGNRGYEGYLCDVWSAGVTLYYMLSGMQPFKANSIKDLESIVLQGKFEEIEDVSQEANDLIEQMLQVDPKNRITIDNILKHPWLRNVDLENRKNLNLFTQSEKILLSKFDVDYLVSNKEELIENFSLKNLETNNNDTNSNIAGDTKSLIFAPYNSYIEESNAHINHLNEEEEIYKELEIHNNFCKFGFKVQQANIKYELSNNNDFDNGVIKTQREEDIKNQNEKIEKKYEEKLLNDKLSGLNTPRVRSANDSFEESEKIIINSDIIKKIEKEVGFDRKYIINCIKENKINYATATYYLMTKDITK